MPTTGLVAGTKLRIFDDTVAVARATDCSIDLQMDTQSVSHKDSAGGFASITPGEISGTATCSALYEEVAGGLSGLYTKFVAGTAVTVKFTTGVTGDKVWSGSALITAWNLKGTHKEIANGTVTFTFNGAVAMGVVA